MTSSQQKVFTSCLATPLCAQDLTGLKAFLRISFLAHKNQSWVKISQLSRADSWKQDYRCQEVKLESLETFPELRTWMDQVFALILTSVAAYVHMCICEKASIMASIVLRSEGLLQSQMYKQVK